MTPYPILLLTGFLGAGKTTVLNQLLALPQIQERHTVLIVNEFGKIGIDASLLENPPQDCFELNKGSLFCICIKTDFLKTLKTIADELRPDLVIIEATGIAETRDIEAFTSEPHIADQFAIQANLCVVDARDYTRLAPMLRAARAQVAWADALLLNKCDLVTEEEIATLRQILKEMNPDALVAETTQGRVEWNFLNALQHRPHQEEALLEEPPDPLFALAFREQACCVDREKFFALIEQLGDKILRFKGNVDFGQGARFVEKAGTRVTEKETSAPNGELRLAVIAWHLPEAELKAAFSEVIGNSSKSEA